MKTINEKQIKIGATRYLIRSLIAPVLMGTVYFVSAGNIQNARAWFYYALFFSLSVAINGILYIKKPELLFHRSKFNQMPKVGING